MSRWWPRRCWVRPWRPPVGRSAPTRRGTSRWVRSRWRQRAPPGSRWRCSRHRLRATRSDDWDAALRSRIEARDRAAFSARLHDAVRLHPVEPRFAVLAAGEAIAHRDRRALSWINRGMRLAPGWTAPHLQAFQFLWLNGRRDQALLELRAAAEIEPTSVGKYVCSIAHAGSAAVLRAAPHSIAIDAPPSSRSRRGAPRRTRCRKSSTAYCSASSRTARPRSNVRQGARLSKVISLRPCARSTQCNRASGARDGAHTRGAAALGGQALRRGRRERA